nr:WYL domain-containing protein [Microbacterium lemovicicum]
MPTTSSRMLALLSLLQTRRDWPGPVLAERLDVTPRTVRRDVDRLRELGYTIASSKGPDGGYRLSAGSELPPLLFDDAQAVAIAVALQSVPSSGVDLDDAATRALLTVRQVMPSRLRHRIDGIRFSDTTAREQVDPAVLESVSAAVHDRRTVRFDYGDESDRPPRRAEPHGVVARAGRWYLVAWDLDREDWRTFRLDRLRPKAGGVPFTPRPIPSGDAAAFVEARFMGATDAAAWPVHGEFMLPLPPGAVAPWIGDGDLEELPDGGCRVRIGSWSYAGLMSWVLRFDVAFAIIAPPELRTAAGVVAARLAAARTALTPVSPTPDV